MYFFLVGSSLIPQHSFDPIVTRKYIANKVEVRVHLLPSWDLLVGLALVYRFEMMLAASIVSKLVLQFEKTFVCGFHVEVLLED